MSKLTAGMRLFLQGGTYILGLVLMRAGNFLLIPLYVAYLSTAEYGAVSVLEMGVQLFVVVALAGQTHALLRFGVDSEAHGKEALQKLERAIRALILLASLFCMGAAAATWPLWSAWLDQLPFWPLGVAALVGLPGTVLFRFALARLQMRGKAGAHTKLQSARWLFLLASVLIFVVGLDLGATGLLLAGSLSFTAAVVLSRLGDREAWKLSWSTKTWRTTLAYGLPLIPHMLTGIVLQATDRTLLAAHSGLAAAGIYTLATKLASVVLTVSAGMQRAWLPFFLREDRDAAKQGWNRVRKLSFFALTVVAVATASVGALAPELVALLGSEEFQGAVVVVPLLAFGAFLQSFYLVAASVVFAETKTARLIALVTVPAALLNVFLNTLWIPSYGLAGAAWATIASSFILALFTGVLARRARSIPFKYVRSLLLILMVSAALYVVPDRPLLERLAVLAVFGLCLLALDARDLWYAGRSFLTNVFGQSEPSRLDDR